MCIWTLPLWGATWIWAESCWLYVNSCKSHYQAVLPFLGLFVGLLIRPIVTRMTQKLMKGFSWKLGGRRRVWVWIQEMFFLNIAGSDIFPIFGKNDGILKNQSYLQDWCLWVFTHVDVNKRPAPEDSVWFCCCTASRRRYRLLPPDGSRQRCTLWERTCPCWKMRGGFQSGRRVGYEVREMVKGMKREQRKWAESLSPSYIWNVFMPRK